MANILITARYPGAFNAVLPVYEALQGTSHATHVMAGGVAYERFKQVNSHVIFSDTVHHQRDLGEVMHKASRILSNKNIDLVVTGTASRDYGIDEAVTVAANTHGVPVLTVQDYWATLQLTHFSELSIATRYAVMDAEAQKIMVERYKIPQERIAVTGQPAFDKYGQFPVLEKYRSIREQLGVKEDEKLVVYATQPNAGSVKTLEALVEGLKALSAHVRLAVMVHPREIDDMHEGTYTRYRAIASSYDHAFPFENIRDINRNDSDGLIAAADLLVTQYSTVGMIAHHMLAAAPYLFSGAHVAYFLLQGEGLGAQALMEEKGMTTLPPITAGAGFGQFGFIGLHRTLRLALFNADMRTKQQRAARQHYLPGIAAENVVKEVLRLLPSTA